MSGDEQQPPETTGTIEQGLPTAGPTEWRVLPRPVPRWWRVLIVVVALLLLVRLILGIMAGLDASSVASLLGTGVLGLFIWAQLRPRTRATEDGLEMRRGLARPLLVPWSEVSDLTAEGGRWATAVTVHLADGRRYPLPAVQPEQLDEVRAARARLAHHDPTRAAREG